MANKLKETACIVVALHKLWAYYTTSDMLWNVSRELLANLIKECVREDDKSIFLFEDQYLSTTQDKNGELCIHDANYPHQDKDRNIIDYMLDMCILSQDYCGPEYTEIQTRTKLFFKNYSGVGYYERLFLPKAKSIIETYNKKNIAEFKKKIKYLKEKNVEEATFKEEICKKLEKNLKELMESEYPFEDKYIPDSD